MKENGLEEEEGVNVATMRTRGTDRQTYEPRNPDMRARRRHAERT